ncbi:MAG: hypothetical protein P1U34_03370 [Coxiellaceae bacterium]|nr:hypothetical protein [Coxiellaceae bacterium]
MPNQISTLKTSADEWGMGGLGEHYKHDTVFAMLDLVEAKSLCDTNNAEEIKHTTIQLCRMQERQRLLISQLDSDHIKLLLSLNPVKRNRVITEDIDSIKHFCILLSELNRIRPGQNADVAHRYNSIMVNDLFHGYDESEMEQHLKWLATLNSDQILPLSDREYISLNEVLTLNKHRAWQQAIVIGPGLLTKILDTASTAEAATICSTHYELSHDERSILPDLPLAHIKALLLLPEVHLKRMLEFEISSLAKIATQLSATHIYCDEEKADDTRDGWWMLSQFGYAETMQRIEKSDQLIKIKEIIADAYTLKGLGAFGLADATGPKTVTEKFGNLALPDHYPLDAPAAIDDSPSPLNELNELINDTKSEIAAIACVRLAAIPLPEKGKEGPAAATPAAARSMFSIFTAPLQTINDLIEYGTARHPRVQEWYEKAREYFPKQIKNPPSKCASPSSVGSADDAVTDALPSRLDGYSPSM